MLSKSEAFRIGRGVNISHWLSQRKPEAVPGSGYFSEIDAGFLASLGFDHLRLPIDEPILWGESGNRREAEWKRLHDALGWCHRHGLRAIVDLHIVRSHYFNAGFHGKDNPLWTSREAQDRLVGLWEELSRELADYPESAVAYEILNEPVSPDPETWNDIVARVHAALRQREPARVLVIGANLWQKAVNVPLLRVPDGDPNLIISFHYYEPGTVTHYRTNWTVLHEYEGPVRYPGVPYPPDSLPPGASPQLRTLLEDSNRHYDRKVIREEVNVAVAHARRLGLPVNCGEWGCYRAVPEPVRLAWYKDVRSVFDELGVSWTIWDYKGGFRIVNPDTFEAEDALLKVLLSGSIR